ncbi:MAG: alpha/beta hydrolase [Candidatus Aminicenantes bacterium]|nr:MAG: alpha/beta hydrolase [Candidatus Aminicenantes bacterium]
MSLILLITAGLTLFNPVQASSPANGEIEGIWLGTLRFSGMELRIVFTISRSPDNMLTATYDVPEQSATDVPVTKITFSDREVRLEIIPIDGVYHGKLSVDGTKIDGNWTQSGMTLPLVLERTQKKLEIKRPQEPKEPFPYRIEEVVIKNIDAGITLAGTLTLPDLEGTSPAALLLSGSGPQDRDEAAFGHRPFFVLADYLTRRGIAVLRVDDRGVGGSTGDFDKATAKDYASDAMVCVTYLKSRKEIDHELIGLIGHSEGGMIAPMVAVQSPDIAFLVLIASPGMAIKNMEFSEQARILKANDASDDLIARNRAVLESLFALINQETDSKIVQDEFTSIISDFFNGLSGEEKKITGISEENLEVHIHDKFRRLHSPWFRFYLNYDPGIILQKITCPVLAINGEKDVQVTPEENLLAITKALKAGGNKNFTVKELPDLNHLLQSAETGKISEYGKIEETMSPTALQIIGNWILEQTGASRFISLSLPWFPM